MKKLIIVLALVVLCFVFCGCSAVVDTAAKVDANMASYLGVEKLNLNCRAGIAQADQDISPDSAPGTRVSALVKYADKESSDYKQCYSGMAWLSYVGKKAEGAVSSFVSKLTELGILAE